MKENYISIDLNDPRAKDISEIIGNKTCNKILNLLAEKELNESEISEELEIPLNSVDYNIKKLIKSGLIESSKHKWSVRGKKMPEYKLSDKKIIISPRKLSTKSLVIPALIIGGALTFIVKKITSVKEVINFNSYDASPMMATKELAPTLASQAVEKTSFINSLASWEWFLIGIWLGTIILFGMSYIKQKNERR